MTGAAARLPGEHKDDTTGAGAAREAAEELKAVARHVRSLTGAESGTLLVGLQRRLTDAIVAVEDLAERQLSAASIGEARFAAGWEACLAARHGLHAV